MPPLVLSKDFETTSPSASTENPVIVTVPIVKSPVPSILVAVIFSLKLFSPSIDWFVVVSTAPASWRLVVVRLNIPPVSILKFAPTLMPPRVVAEALGNE